MKQYLTLFEKALNVLRYFFEKREGLEQLRKDLERKILEEEQWQEEKIKKENDLEEDAQNWETIKNAVDRSKENPCIGYVVPGIMKAGAICNLIAAEKSGKSLLAYQIAIDSATGNESKLVPPGSGKVLRQSVYYFDAEMDDDDMKERYHNLGDVPVHRRARVFFDNPIALIKNIEHVVKQETESVLVIVDNVTAICPGYVEAQIRELNNGIRALQKYFSEKNLRLTIIFIHHAKRGTTGMRVDDIAGSKTWSRLGNLNLALVKPGVGDDSKLLTIINARGQNSLLKNGEGLLLRLVESPYPHFEYVRNASLDGGEEAKGKQPPSCESLPKGKPWTLSEDEEKYVLEKYIPNVYGCERLAKDLLQKRGRALDKKSVGCMKSAVNRLVKLKGSLQMHQTDKSN